MGRRVTFAGMPWKYRVRPVTDRGNKLQTTSGKSLIFSSADQPRFAELSGDFNPIHVDTKEARRLLFGRTVVHGVHAVCAVLERQADLTDVYRLRVRFSRPMFPDTPLTLSVRRLNEDTEEISISDRDGVCTNITAYRKLGRTVRSFGHPPMNVFFERFPSDVAPASFEEMSGRLPLGLDLAICRELFPQLAASWPPLRIAELLATTRLVGMICPGRHSLFVELDIAFASSADGLDHSLEYRCKFVSRQLNLVSITLHGPSTNGEIKAFFRPPPVAQSSMTEIVRKVSSGRFSHVDALVVGGSRGVGEAVAKVISAGGGRVCLTYQSGRDDAERVADEIRSAGGNATILELDVLDPKAGPGTRYPFLYYCASPAIRRSSSRVFEVDHYNRYRAYFVDGVKSVVEIFGVPDKTALFYPSTEFLDRPEHGFREYAKAKEDGEELCARLATKSVQLVCIPRLPRLRTDQTSGPTTPPCADPVAILMPWIETMSVDHPRASVIHRLTVSGPE
jgi:acyl dehydratase